MLLPGHNATSCLIVIYKNVYKTKPNAVWPLSSRDQIPWLNPDFSAKFRTCPELFVWLTTACLSMLLSENVFRHSLHLAHTVSILSSFRLHVMHNLT